MRSILVKTLLAVVLAAIALAVAGAAWLWHSQQRAMRAPLALGGEARTFVVEPGATLREVAESLGARGWLAAPERLVLQARWDGVAASIKAGEYALEPGMTPRDLLRRIVSGDVLLRAFTIVEGWTVRELLAAVRADEHLRHTLEDAAPEAVMARIGAPGVHPEGRFFADTYHFPRGTTDVEFLRRAYRTMERRLAGAWAGRAGGLPYETPDEALVMASIVEKETGVAAERARIAGVFVRRLERGMRLETDPTVIYGLGEGFDGNLRRRDLRSDTAYNTYVREGLPPTPIAIPSLAAIEAALHPADGEALFFVAKGDGSHHFSATYAEHRRAVARYQLGRGAGPDDRSDGG